MPLSFIFGLPDSESNEPNRPDKQVRVYHASAGNNKPPGPKDICQKVALEIPQFPSKRAAPSAPSEPATKLARPRKDCQKFQFSGVKGFVCKRSTASPLQP